MIEYGLILFFPFFMIYAAVTDMLSMTISNKVSICLISGFLIFAFIIGMDLSTFMWHCAVFFIALLFGFTLFAFNTLGGGDAKLIASTALWFGGQTMVYLLTSAVFGAVLALILMKFRTETLPNKMAKVDWIVRLHQDKKDMPYGVALGAGAMSVYPDTPWMQHVYQLSTAF